MSDGINTIVIIGVGQIGSRHLQALANLKTETTIYVIDPSTESLDIAKQRYLEVGKNVTHISVNYNTDYSILPTSLDLAIIATSSNVRKQVIQELIKVVKIQFLILEKVVFQRIEDFEIINSLLISNGIKAWVNCPKRIWPTYNQIFDQIKNHKNLIITVTGSGIGLGCNSIHYIDLLSFYSRNLDINVDSKQLDTEIVPSKRIGFIEFTGTLKITSGKNSSLSITSHKSKSVPPIVYIDTDLVRYIISESTGKMLVSRNDTEWKWEAEEFIVKFQSELTNLVVEEILENSECMLPKYTESIKSHIPFIKSLNSHLIEIKYEFDQETCPIT